MPKLLNSDECIRLDVFLAAQLPISRSQTVKMIDDGMVKLNDKLCKKASVLLKSGEIVEIDDCCFAPKEKPTNKAVPEILYEDADILVINKPAGLVVHDGDGVRESTLVDYLKQNNKSLASSCGLDREGIVHRLDSGTTGVMVVAKNDDAAGSLKESILAKETSKIYLCIVDTPLKSDILVEAPISRDQKNRVKMRVSSDGKESKTLFLKLLESKNSRYELIAAKLLSGRTHQIRVHLGHIGRHIVGDSLYGFKSQNAKISHEKILLHSYVLDIKHPTNDNQISFVASLPYEFTEFLQKEFCKEKINDVTKEAYLYSRIGDFFSGLR